MNCVDALQLVISRTLQSRTAVCDIEKMAITTEPNYDRYRTKRIELRIEPNESNYVRMFNAYPTERIELHIEPNELRIQSSGEKPCRPRD